VTVDLAVSATAQAGDTRARIVDALRRHLDALEGGSEGEGWPFGDPVRPSALAGVVQRTIGPEATVTRFSAALDGGPPSDCADLAIGPRELVWLGEATIFLGRGIAGRQGAAMSWGRDIRLKDLLMLAAEVDGGLEPQLVAPSRQDVRTQVAARIDAYTPEWTNRRRDDAGVALVLAYGTLAEAVNVRLNRAPRKLALEHLDLAGVRALQARPAQAILGIEVAARATAAVDLPAGSPFLVPGGPVPVVIETLSGCRALPGRLASVAVLADGWLVNDAPAELGAMAPFGPRPRVPAELWLGIESPVAPAALLSIAVELAPSPGRATFSAVATQPPAAPPTLRWEAMTSAGAAELPVEGDDTTGLSHSGVLTLGADTPSDWTARALPGRPDDPPLYWLRARLITNDFPRDRRLARVTLNGVTAVAARTIRDEVLEPLERSSTGRSHYRLSQIPVVPGSVEIEVADSAGDPFGEQQLGDTDSVWTEVDDLATRDAQDPVFLLDAATGVVTFGDGVHGGAVPDGYRNVVARVYMAGGGSSGLPAPGDTISPQQSVPASPARRSSRSRPAPTARRRRSSCCAGRPRSARAAEPSRPATTRRWRSPPRAPTSRGRTACRGPTRARAMGSCRASWASSSCPRPSPATVPRCPRRRSCAPSPTTSRARSASSARRSSRRRRATARSRSTPCSSHGPAATWAPPAAQHATRSTRGWIRCAAWTEPAGRSASRSAGTS